MIRCGKLLQDHGNCAATVKNTVNQSVLQCCYSIECFPLKNTVHQIRFRLDLDYIFWAEVYNFTLTALNTSRHIFAYRYVTFIVTIYLYKILLLQSSNCKQSNLCITCIWVSRGKIYSLHLKIFSPSNLNMNQLTTIF
jgi:hypothetical protein